MAKSLKTRSWLVVDPAADVEVVYATGADAVVLDFASQASGIDGSADQFCSEWPRLGSGRMLAALIPPFSSGTAEAATDLAVHLGITTVILSGASCGADVQRLDVILRVAELRSGLESRATAVIALADESGLLVSGSFVNSSRRLKALGWEIGGHPQSDVARLARATMVLAASAAGVDAIDPISSTDDEKAFRAECLTARENGATGKLCRLPWQIPLINQIYSDQSPAPVGLVISNTSEPPSA